MPYKLPTLQKTVDQIFYGLSASPFDAALFDAALDNLAASAEPGLTAACYGLLDDRFSLDGPMFRIVHVMEDASDADYIAGLLEVAAYEIPRAPRWSSTVFMRVLNSSATKLELIRQLPAASPETRAVVKALLDNINRASPEFLAKTVPVLVATG